MPKNNEDVLTEEDFRCLDRILDDHGHDPTQIVGILLDTQEHFPLHYVPKEAAYYIAERLPVKLALIYDCLTFYHALSDVPRARHPIGVCHSVVCAVNASQNVVQWLHEALHINFGEATEDRHFCLEEVPCFGACDRAPAVRVDGEIFGPLQSRADVDALLARFS